MNNSNKSKEKNPVLQEILEDATPIAEDTPPAAPKLSDIMAKDPTTLTAQEMDILSDNKEDLTDEQKVKYGLADAEILEPVPANQPPLPIEPEAPTPPDDTTIQSDTDRLAEQRREAQIISAQNKKITETIDQAATLPEPTEEELRVEVRKNGVEWEDLTEFEKTLFKQNIINARKFDMVHQVTKDIHQIDQWANKVDDFLVAEESAQQYKALIGHEGDFRKYAMTESHRGIDLEILLNAFLNKMPPVPKARRGDLFPVGGGEAPAAPKSDIITDADEAQRLKVSDPREYARKIKAGKIKLEV